jgi:fibronectin-binding autotransporter adhesin
MATSSLEGSLSANRNGRSRAACNIRLAMAAATASLCWLPAGFQAASADTLLWTNAAADNNWDNVSTNWEDESTSGTVAYSDPSPVQFNDTNGGTVATPGSVIIGNVTGATPNGVSPNSVVFLDNGGVTGSYTFTAASGDTLGIQGSASVTLDASYSGLVYLNEVNTYTGGTVIDGGTLQSNAAGTAFGTGSITLGGDGVLQFSHSATITNGVIVTAGSTASLINATSTSNNPTFVSTIASSAGATVANTVLNISGGETMTISPVSAANTMSGFTGTIDWGASATFMRFNPFANTSALGSSSALFNLGTSGTLNMQNATGVVLLGAIEGGTGTTLAGAGHSGTNYNNQSEYVIGGAGVDTTFDGIITQGSERNNLVVMDAGSLTLSNGGNSYGSKLSGSYQGPGTTILGQGQSAPDPTASVPTFGGMPVASAGGTLLVDNATGSATGPAPIFIEGATTSAGSGGTLGGDGIIAGLVSTLAAPFAGTPSAPNDPSFAAGPVIVPKAVGINASKTLTLSGGLTLGDYVNLDYSLDTLPATADDALISMGSAGVLTLPSDGLVQVNFTFPNGSPELGTPYTLIGYTAADVNGGSSVASWSATGIPIGDTATFTDTGSAIDVTFAAVPEPASLGILGLGAATILRRRRRRA